MHVQLQAWEKEVAEGRKEFETKAEELSELKSALENKALELQESQKGFERTTLHATALERAVKNIAKKKRQTEEESIAALPRRPGFTGPS